MTTKAPRILLVLATLGISLLKAYADDAAILEEMGNRLKQLQREIATAEDPKRRTHLQADLVQVMEQTLPKLSAAGQVPLLLSLRVMQPFQTASAEYAAASVAYAESDDLSFATIKQQSDIAKRIATVNKLRAANLALIAMLENAESRAAQVIGAHKDTITDQQRRDFIAGFAKGNRRLAETSLIIRHLDTHLYDTIHQMLKLLDAHYGKWSVDGEGYVIWQSENLDAEFTKLGEELANIAEKQAAAEDAMSKKI